MNNFIHLHVHSHYSNKDGAQTVKQIVTKAAKLNMPAVALTDHGMAGGLLQLKKECEKADIKWIPGVEFYCAQKDHTIKEKIEGHSKINYHLTVLAKNYEGLKNLFRLSSISWIDGFYYKSRIDDKLLQKYKEGLIVLSGCAGSKLSTFILEDRFKEARDHISFMKETFKDNFYIEVQNHELDFQVPINAGAITLAEEFNIPVVATQDSHYQEAEDAELHKHICKLASGNLEFDSNQNWFKSREEMEEMFVGQENYLDQTIGIANKVNVEWDYSKTIWPVYPLPNNKTSEEELKELTYKGFNKLFPEATQEYNDRLEEELEVIISMGFASYFLIVQDFANWCRDQGMATTAGRGCLTGETPIITASGNFKFIKNIQIGDKIFNRFGEIDTVTNTFKYNINSKELIKFETVYGDFRGLTLTKDHKIFGEKSVRKWGETGKKGHPCYYKPTGDIKELQAQDLEKSDWILFPKLKVQEQIFSDKIDLKKYIKNSKDSTKIIDNIIYEYVPTNRKFIGSIRDIHNKTGIARNVIIRYRIGIKPKQKNTRQEKSRKIIKDYILEHFKSLEEWRNYSEKKKNSIRKINRYIKTDKIFFWLLGKWVADGWFNRKSNREWGICFNSETEQNQVNKTINWLKKNKISYNINKAKNRKLIQITASSGPLFSFWKKIFPRYNYSSQTKHFPDFISNLPEENIESILHGYIDGDGSAEKSKLRLTTTSKEIAEQLKFLLLRLGIPSSIRFYVRHDKREGFPDILKSYYINAPIVGFITKIYPEKATQKKNCWHETNQGILCRIRKKTYINGVNTVYDLSVKQDPSYLTSSGVVHNSSAGSLACYCLGITEVDPIKYNLLFSRFLDPVRAEAGGLCDIDYDVQKDRRHELIQYVTEKYGQDRLSQIGTYSEFKPRGALRDFARTCGYEPNIGDKLAKMVPADIAGKALKFDKVIEAEPKFLKVEEQDVIKLARKSEGIKKQIGVHPAGMVIADRPINEVIPLFLGRGGEVTAQFDMHDVEEVGLVKFDFLGLKNLTVIGETLKLIKQNHNINIDISKIKDGDKDTYDLFYKGDLTGIFQFETSTGFKELCMQTQPVSIEDLSSLNSLFRPGPIGQNMLSEYVERRNGKKFNYEIPELEPILKSTYGVIIYQEQIMRICTDIAGYTRAESSSFRKIVGKKLEDKMEAEHNKFVSGCINSSNIEKVKAEELFKNIEDFAKYGFCAGHSIAYSFLSYRTGWLKAHYQEEFYTALLNTAEGPDDLVKYIHSVKEHNIPLLSPDVNRSSNKFKLDNGAIVFGLSGVKDIGEKACEKLLAARPKEGFIEIYDLIKAKINKKVITALAECGALESISEFSRNQITEHIPDLILYYNKLSKWEIMKEKRVVRQQEIEAAVEKGIKPPRRLKKLKDKPELPELSEPQILTKDDRLALELKTLGIYLTGHPLDGYPKLLTMSKYTIEDIKQGLTNDNEFTNIPIVLSSLKKKFSKKKRNYGISILEDHTGRIDCSIFPAIWDKINQKLEEGKPYVAKIKVRIEEQDEGPTISKVSLMNVSPITEKEKISNLKVTLKDETEVIFVPPKDVNESKWQQATAYVKNLRKMV